MRHTIFTLFFTFIYFFQASAQQSPVSWTIQFNKIAEDEVELVATAKIDKDWYVYSQKLESDEGPIPTSINYEDSSQVAKWVSNKESASKSSYKLQMIDEVFEMKLTKYKHDFTIRQVVKVADINQEIAGFLEYMTCNATMCRPPTAVEFSFNLASLESQEGNVDQSQGQDEEEDQGQDEDEGQDDGPFMPVSWSIEFDKVSDLEVDLVATATIAKGWYVYSQTLESDDGPIKTTINYEDSSNIESWGANEESATQPEFKLQSMDEVFEMELTKYKHDFTITQRLTIKDSKKPITGYLEYMTCDATQCMPPTAVEFNFSFAENTGDNTNPFSEAGIYNPANPMLIKTNLNPIGNCDGQTGASINETANVANMGWLTIFLWGLAGGFVALLTPCVFPMIPMTVSLFSKGKDRSKSESIKNALIFGGSIIVIYVSLGLLITATFGASSLNLLSTHWLMNLTFFVLFTVFAISFFGYFEITLPSSWANKAESASDRGGLIGTFFGAFSICLVSFSCTGPIIGTLLVEAVKVGYFAPSIGMLGFSVALALPFTLFAAFPSWLKSLPNSGSWMTTMKVILGFVELALGLKFLSTADLTEHWGIMPYELFILLWGIIFTAMAIYLFGFIHFPHDNKSAKISTTRKAFGGLTAAFAIYIFMGFMSTESDTFITPPLLSGLAPAVCYSYIKPCECPATLDECFHDYYEGLAHAKKVGKPLLVDFTGYGCVNCRKMEDNVWTVKEVNDIIRNEYVLVSLYVDDRAKLEKTLVTPTNKKIRNVGNKWAEFQNVNFAIQSQPLYVLINTKEEVLNTPAAYTPNVDTYKDFLNCGLQQFKESMKE
jgi:thiol:disulfide interchange protein DsbD